MPRTPESRVVEIWQERLLGQSRFTAEGGDVVSVLYPGRRNDDRGADFRDAVVGTSQGLLRGHIEVHAMAGDWQSHGHHLDPCYNQVVLHVALSGAGRETRLENGTSVPLVTLDKSRKSRRHRESASATPCSRAAGRRRRAVTEMLDSAGDDRFIGKAHRFRAEMVDTEPDQCLYQGLMGALGYSKNKLPFMELARRASLRLIETVCSGEPSEEEYLSRVQSLLLVTAGFVPVPPAGMERVWRASPQPPPVMTLSDWPLFRVRPGNHPVRRIAAVGRLLYRFRGRALHHTMLDLVTKACESEDTRVLDTAFVVTDASGRVLLGGDRAALIAVNVLLPFALAWSLIKSLPALGAEVTRLYHRYPRLAANSVERHMMQQLGLEGGQVNCARRQQGLIQIYEVLCTQGRCEQCPLDLST